jgi:hypothetical protein
MSKNRLGGSRESRSSISEGPPERILTSKVLMSLGQVSRNRPPGGQRHVRAIIKFRLYLSNRKGDLHIRTMYLCTMAKERRQTRRRSSRFENGGRFLLVDTRGRSSPTEENLMGVLKLFSRKFISREEGRRRQSGKTLVVRSFKTHFKLCMKYSALFSNIRNCTLHLVLIITAHLFRHI